MFSILKKEKGNLSIVMLLAVIGMASGLSMAGLVLRDYRGFFNQVERIQTQMLLRGETYRGQAFVTSNPFLTGRIDLPVREINISTPRMNRTYRSTSRIVRARENVLIGDADMGVMTATQATEMDTYKMMTLVETSIGTGFGSHFDDNKTLVRRYGELLLVQSSFSEFMYFSAFDISPAGKNVYFYGEDLVTGKVHSNTDINIKNLYGWPKFMNLVTTAGHVVSYSGGYNKDEVFPGGLIEEYDVYEFPSSAEALRNGGNILRYGTPDKTILYVRSNGGTANGMTGTILSPQRKRVPVTGTGSTVVFPPYALYPGQYAPPRDTLYTNVFSVSDTLWQPVSFTGTRGKGYLVEGSLWIEGTFSGFQTWGCSHDMYLLNDIKLSGTALGQDPISNRNDVVGLISEQSIHIKYGYADPFDTTGARVHPNCGSDSEYPGVEGGGGGIMIYAAMIALGDGGTNMSNYNMPNFKDGVFTFEYMHPHGSTPSINWNYWITPDSVANITYDWIDIHRRVYPAPKTGPTAWPPLIDLPWYNPIWPEQAPYKERGTINIYGAVAQRRRGFVHRSGNDDEYPSNDGIWDIEIDMCGGPISQMPPPDPVFPGLQLFTRNWPGASGSGSGYKKNYNFDHRFFTIQPLFYPEARLQGGKLPMTHGNWKLMNPDQSVL
ncbi:MAG: hypothetical protein GX106_02310 [Candidatus Cloacimonetes bacterium]|jgi:hypothetical protein|nr:hypothetical protein [Candidatus Cloacimonadota bacterium]